MKNELYQKILAEGVFLPEKSSDGQFCGDYSHDAYLMPDGNIIHCNYEAGDLESIEVVVGPHPIVPSITVYTPLWSRK